MLDINKIRHNPAEFNLAMKNRGEKYNAEDIIKIDAERRANITKEQALQQKRNELAKEIGIYPDKKSTKFAEMLTEAAKIKQEIAELEHELKGTDTLEKLLENIPNIPEEIVPVGEDEQSNVEIKRIGDIPKFNFSPKQHFELGEDLEKIDFATAAKMSGSRFTLLKGEMARLERAIANFMLDMHTSEFGYTEISVPYLVKDHAMYGVGQLPKFEEDSFATTNGYRLIPTGEVPLTNIVADKIISETELPLRFTAYTPCFRSEAGSAGRDTRGMIRLHQFSKVELVSITTQEKSKEEHERMLNCAEEILKRLELPYRVMILSTGDMGFSSQKTYDLEVWLPGQNTYREISSCSNCGDFQARRMKARYRSGDENLYVHTLNGSALAVGRTLVAILENYQNQDGTVHIPSELVKYMNGLTKISKA